MPCHYVYILQAEKEPARFYIGSTEDLPACLKKHRTGEVPHKSQFHPWKIKTQLVFKLRNRFANSERIQSQPLLLKICAHLPRRFVAP